MDAPEGIAAAVQRIMLDSLYTSAEVADGQPPPDAVMVEGIVQRFVLHPQRLAAHFGEIVKLCNQMPEPFQIRRGGGWSFLNMCVTRDGEQWGEHKDCEALTVLAIGSGIGGYCMPRESWGMFPGGMPYVYFDTLNA